MGIGRDTRELKEFYRYIKPLEEGDY